MEMTQYLLAVYQPDGEPPPPEFLEPIMEAVGKVEQECKDSGAWVFSGGLTGAESATVVRVQDGRELLTDGPFAEGKEHLGGFTIVDVPDLDAALVWGKKFAAATGLPLEVRAFRW
ncbi:hypothetical protein Val02_07840 [Virgisporangium aliadipatigenens]|uniref:YCII-related domain-containing protein n=1 Tax=Virgisporangium aliadipatigenens TaxID=741659 RepID=A0A8J3YH61_9ACTN|nr:YciI family protein [Virgisporangium aliadipatigenens]GIJ43898.1 hypothetical protein Val02_07840 [Virgisporangium aliadipatigenens]